MVCDYNNPKFEIGYELIEGERYLISSENERTLMSDKYEWLADKLRGRLEPESPEPESDSDDSIERRMRRSSRGRTR